MHQILEDLWFGNINLCEQTGSGTPEIEQLIALMERHKENLSSNLAEPNKSTFEKFIDCTCEYTDTLSFYAFKAGFCFAGKLMSEIFSPHFPPF